jgi:hypothetical protein
LNKLHRVLQHQHVWMYHARSFYKFGAFQISGHRSLQF